MNLPRTRPSSSLIFSALATVYVVWGSTYLAIRFALESWPPFLLGGVRFFLAGLILFGAARVKYRERLTAAHWKSTALVGVLLLFGGNGSVVYAQQTVPSGTAALIVSTVPIWMVLLNWLAFSGPRPTRITIMALVLGFSGVVLLLEIPILGVHIPWTGLLLVAASLSWALGSVYARRATMPSSPLLATAMEMLAGGIALIIASGLHGEWSGFNVADVTFRSGAALIYLFVFGSIVAFTAYIWLLQNASLALVSTYAYVNPVVALILGSWLAGETLKTSAWAGAALVLAAVVMITTDQRSST
jgi:drug/metabolite transporter (DMT)-like permease